MKQLPSTGVHPADSVGITRDGTRIRETHVPGDPESVHRLYIERKGCCIEICPSKGLSVRDAYLNNRRMFWNPPLTRLPDPEEIDLSGEILLNGIPTPGMKWVEYFAAHIEMLGLCNWGMPIRKAGGLLPLHGNVSSIPVENVLTSINKGGAVVKGSFQVFNADSVHPRADETPLFQVEKRIELPADREAILLRDIITNVSSETLVPDWGYHVQLRPEPGCRFHIPSADAALRGGGMMPQDYEIWNEAADTPIRQERGVVHKGVRYEARFPDDSPACETLLTYADGSGIRCLIPPSPYVLSWFSCGGAGGNEFLRTDGSKWLETNWDGVGPEFGASSLDHDGDGDPAVRTDALEPGESTRLNILVEPFESSC